MRTLDDILKRAREELRINPTVEVYDFKDGHEVNRRLANPWAKFNAALSRATFNFDEMREAFGRIAEAMRHMKPPELGNWFDDETRRRQWNTKDDK